MYKITRYLAMALLPLVTGNRTEAEGPGTEYNGVKLEEDKALTVQTLPARIDIRENILLKNYSANMFGLNYNWLSYDGLRVAKAKKKNELPAVSEEYLQAMQGIPLPLNRMSGTGSQYLSWKKAIGPMKLRKKQKRMPWDGGAPQKAGPVEWINSCRAIDKDAQFAWVVNMYKDTPQDAADLAEFFMGGPETEWGKKRLEYGLKAPVRPVIWELGNELDWSHEKMPVNEYIKRCREVMAAIRKVHPDAVFAAHAKTAPWADSSKKIWMQWHQEVLKYLANDIQYIAFHPYYHGHKPAYVEQFVNRIQADIANSSNPDIKLFMSEHAKWPSGRDKGKKEWRRNWYQTHALVGCLDTAEWLLRMLDRPDVTAMTYHSQSAGPWGIIYRDRKSGKYYTTGIADMLKLFADLPGGKIVDCNVSGPHTNVKKNDLSFTAAAVTGRDKKLYLILNNRLPNTSREVTFDFQNKYRLKRIQTLSAPDLHSYNTAGNKPITIKTETIDNNKDFSSYKVPPRSLVFLELKQK